ncbi:hypothetical protein BT63DRAFT_418265 [Microthyrium microscopicum]|uniref:Uncharacterized protein n=1 Tax=Microthyrium microscopicum TaxID=703497 RepID=A0A6A6TWE2_9PEZI|nr:hypothetical protein BT63DRAFT_418265 [Microthyrium microscopicum]
MAYNNSPAVGLAPVDASITFSANDANTAITKQNHDSSRLLRLPAELRLMIWAFVCEAPEEEDTSRLIGQKHALLQGRRSPYCIQQTSKRLRFLLTCRNLYQDAYEMAFSKMPFLVSSKWHDHLPALGALMARVTPRSAQLISNMWVVVPNVMDMNSIVPDLMKYFPNLTNLKVIAINTLWEKWLARQIMSVEKDFSIGPHLDHPFSGKYAVGQIYKVQDFHYEAKLFGHPDIFGWIQCETCEQTIDFDRVLKIELIIAAHENEL